MDMDSLLVGSEYASHLTDTDIRLLASVAAGTTNAADPAAGTGEEPEAVTRLRRDPATLLALLEDPLVFQTVLAVGEDRSGYALPMSPFLVFAVTVHRAAAELADVGYVAERTAPRQRVPLFDAPALRDFLDEPARRLFLAELLASFTRIGSGRYQVRSGGQVRTQRFSELDPVRLAGMLEAVPDAERPGVYRRLGDVALFLAGVFPDYAASHALGPVNVSRLLRAARVPAADTERLSSAPAIDLLEYLGARWYRAARDLALVRTARLGVVAEVADRFRQARRVLNHVADRYLFPAGNSWLPRPGSQAS
jgi:hypothetical protein